jgi:hypothetical protein
MIDRVNARKEYINTAEPGSEHFFIDGLAEPEGHILK